MDVVQTPRSPIARVTEVGAVDEDVEFGTGLAGLLVVDHLSPPATREIHAETRSCRFDVDRLRPEKGDLVTGRETFGNRATHLFTTAVGGPVEVVDRDTTHFETSHRIRDPRET